MRSKGMIIRTKRVYDPVAEDDGMRVLVDRLWPRGLSKARARVDNWARELAPSDALRRWFGHDPARWEEFRARYLAELRAPPQRAAMAALRARADNGKLTLLYAAKDRDRNNALVLKEALDELLLGGTPTPGQFAEER